jgi:putative ABC transport system ATP-binding protein
MANTPSLILADEPTGNLDSARSAEILDLLLALNRDRGICLVLVTHDEQVAAVAGRRLAMRDGKLVG